MKKLLIASLLAISCICTAAGISACGDSSDKYVDGVKYSLSSDETCYYVGRIDETYTDIEILSEYNGLPVTKISSGVFDDCTALKNITIGDNIITMGDNIASGIDGEILRYCTALESINVSSGNTTYKSIDGNLYSSDETELIKYSVGKSNKSFEIPDSVTYISSYAFYGCTTLENVTIPDSVATIDSRAFMDCTSLTSLTIPDSVTNLNGAIYNCTSLTSLSIGKNVSKLYDFEFYNCTSLTEIYYNAISVETSSSTWHLFSFAGNDGEGLTVTIGNCVETIPDFMFYILDAEYQSGVVNYTNKVVSIVFEENSVCESIGESSFNSIYITTITIPDSVKKIGSGAFYGCKELESVRIGNAVSTIYSHAFYGCSKLKNVTLPSSLTYIARYTFDGCESLESVTFNNTNNWYITDYDTVPSKLETSMGTKINVTDSNQNATYLTDTYSSYSWFKG